MPVTAAAAEAVARHVNNDGADFACGYVG